MIWDDRYDDLGPALDRGRATVHDLTALTEQTGRLSKIAPRFPLHLTTDGETEGAATSSAWAVALCVIACVILACVAVPGGAAVLAAFG